MAVQKGFNTSVSFGVEVTAGTEVSRTVRSRVASTTLQAKRNSDRVPHLIPSSGSRNAKTMFTTSVDVNGSVEMPAAYAGNGLGLLLEAALGSVATTGSGPYTHTFTLGSSLIAMSAAVERGVGASLGDEEFYGLKVNTFELSVAPGQVMSCKIDLIGMTSGARGSDSPPALGTFYPILHKHAGQLSFDSANYTLASFTLRVNNALARLDELGSEYSSEPEVTDFQTVEIECELVARSDALYTAHKAQTASDAVITFSDGTRSIEITLQNAEITSYEDPISDPGVIKQKVTFTGLGDDTDHGLKVVLINANSSSRTA